MLMTVFHRHRRESHHFMCALKRGKNLTSSRGFLKNAGTEANQMQACRYDYA
jgi:hypothetical protein